MRGLVPCTAVTPMLPWMLMGSDLGFMTASTIPLITRMVDSQYEGTGFGPVPRFESVTRVPGSSSMVMPSLVCNSTPGPSAGAKISSFA